MAPKLGDYPPFSLFPEYFSTTIQPMQSPLDVPRYMGKWFEIARLPQTFQKGLTKCEANYSYNQTQGFVNVINKGLKEDGTWKQAEAKAYPKNEFKTYLKVYFTRFFGGPYFIIDLDKEYKWVFVGGPTTKYMWILSRSEEMDPNLLEKIKDKAKELGFDTSKLIYRNDRDQIIVENQLLYLIRIFKF